MKLCIYSLTALVCSILGIGGAYGKITKWAMNMAIHISPVEVVGFLVCAGLSVWLIILTDNERRNGV
jgi:hypothetical protein